MSFHQYGSTKYILLKDIKLDLGIGVEAKRGEVLEGFNQPSRGCLPALFDRSRGIAFSCSAEAAAILTHEEAGYLTGILSLEDRYKAFKEGVAFDHLPDAGSKVFVAIRGREFPGVVVRAVSLFCNQQFKPIFFKVGIQRHITEAEAPMTCQCSTSGFGPKEILMVIASLDMLRPRNEASEVSHECVPAGYQERWLGSISSGKENLPVGVIEEPDSNRFMDEQHEKRKAKKELNERENELNQRNITGLEYIANEHWVQETETTQAEEWHGHEQTNKNPKESGEKLSRDQEEEGFGENDKKKKPVFGIIAADESKQEEKTEDESNEVQWKPEEKEKEVIGVEQQTEDESKKKEKIKDELKEIQFKLDCAIKDKEKAEKKVQKYKEELEELQRTLAEAQSLLKKKPKTESECEWNLSREQIRLLTEKKLGSGSFGIVYKGMFRGTQVAVKQVSVKPKITEYNMKNFQREMRMAARCRHPCMLQFIGATSDDQSPLLVTELMDTSLKAVLLDRELHPIEIKIIALDVAKGLNYLHLTQPYPIVHRDISSGNVLLWQHGQSWRG